MIREMSLFEKPYESMKSGRKKVEVRLNDEKRRKVKRGDIIHYTKLPEQNDRLKVEVLDLKKYDSFKEMYVDIPAEDFDADEQSVEEMLENTYQIYTPEQEKEWGTLAIILKMKG